METSSPLAIYGGRPVREHYLPYGKQRIEEVELFCEVRKCMDGEETDVLGTWNCSVGDE
ncbi:hypothetical protein SAMN05444972_101164 [Marininema halotolerans]|uniref:Uncharacterized protein n=2 Tax=Marininema halotolerans TaxID=1155944 RepID=A0A1I6NVD0_9BACL|nr:hypothetical protein SAMN05444972_101164 [Marininema halotolerans]